jgi:hypothetical protein
MKRRIFTALAFCLAVSMLLAGCGKKEEAAQQKGPAVTATGKPGGPPVGKGPELGVNPNYSGPAEGGYGTRSNR